MSPSDFRLLRCHAPALPPVGTSSPTMITVRPVEQGSAQTQAPVLPPEKQAELTSESKIKQARLQEDLQKWYEDSVCFSEDLARRFGMTPEHYENLMFSGALKIRNSQRKPNTYNAWLHHLSQENSDGEYRKSVPMPDDPESTK